MSDSKRNIKYSLSLIGQGMFSKHLKKSSKDMGGVTLSLEKMAKASQNIDGFKKLGKSNQETSKKLRVTQDRIKTLSREMKAAKKPSAALTKKFNSATAQGKKLKKVFNEQKINLSALRTELKGAGVDVKRLNTEQKRLEAGMKSSSRAVKKAREKGNIRGNIKTGAAGLLAAAGGVVSAQSIINASGDVELAKGEVGSLGVSEKGLSLIEEVGTKISNQFSSIRTADIVRAAYDLKSGVSSLGDAALAKTTGIAAITAKATKADTGVMTTLFAQGYGIYQKQFMAEQEKNNKNWKNLSADQKNIAFFENFSGSISAAVQNFRTDGSKMSEAIGTLGASATSAGVSFEEQIAVLGMLQATAKGGGESATMYKAFLRSAGGASEKLDLNFVDGSGKLKNTKNLIGQLRAKYGSTVEDSEQAEMKKAFGTDEAVAFVQLLIEQGDQLGVEKEKIAAAGKKGTAQSEQMAQALDRGMNANITRLTQQLTNLGNVIGDALSPVINSLTSFASDWAVKLQGLVTQSPKVTSALMVTAGVLGAITTAVVGYKALNKLTGISLPFLGKKKGSAGGLGGGIKGAITGQGAPVFVTNWPGSFGGLDIGGSSRKKGKGKISSKKGAGSVLKRMASKGGGLLKLSKGLGKTALKKIPGLSIFAGLGFGLKRALKGDMKGGGLEVASGLAATLPMVGTAVSLALDGYLMHRDNSQEKRLSEAIAKTTATQANQKSEIIINQELKAEAGADKAGFEKVLNESNAKLVELIRKVVREDNLNQRRVSFGGAAIG